MLANNFQRSVDSATKSGDKRQPSILSSYMSQQELHTGDNAQRSHNGLFHCLVLAGENRLRCDTALKLSRAREDNPTFLVDSLGFVGIESAPVIGRCGVLPSVPPNATPLFYDLAGDGSYLSDPTDKSPRGSRGPDGHAEEKRRKETVGAFEDTKERLICPCYH
ncbi:uncharacterized protein BO96DRAFT_470927 [Aspergillus niger CBS 101883]|uniref:Uncharacterized protein n=3 Tax=Aspergillus niger TaxID=5061 RepID=A2R9T6_ASPNC|nr:uncharacterized protein BO96DRAFT_470927 [Aspergillus niger CBS 101883]XP_059602853.1 hypothetical protein An18g00150 [Aspergillus niger]PYH50182.1 hypothetical protein BO96DRAFT_470927 [Aspergillus niger CBS 101883]RDH14022.1 hypothetical protein M747DRAFT_291145 [Aspergillus niger ATCC 13496]CAK43092.1 hypothetical protein An18g00150 [Aspergillus niger]